ncbi:unnamed protein product [Schistocephalus solidus]|uniref:C2H2-type domain-containing protein n=1 Tax=Schistocephalus solidus TaxID=70667 RepID=A0A183SF55_SCHSO|nr:unnamed protein product [Schistocephalus solidus]
MCQKMRTHVYTTYVNLTKAFDTMNRDGLLKIMQKFGCPERFIHMVRQLHDGTMARVMDNGAVSEAFAVTNGVKHGRVLAPTLFSLILSSKLMDNYLGESPGVRIAYRMNDRPLIRRPVAWIHSYRRGSQPLPSQLPPQNDAPSNINPTAANTSNVDSVPSCPNCNCTFTSRIGLVGHLRIHRMEIGEPLPGAPKYSRRACLHCPHCSRTFAHLMGLPGHMRNYESGIHRDVDTPNTSCVLINTPVISPFMSATTSASSKTPQTQQLPTSPVLIVTTHTYKASAWSVTCDFITQRPVSGAATYTRRTHLNCSHYPRKFTDCMGLFGHMRLQKNLR